LLTTETERTQDGVGEEMKFFTYDIHPRFNILVAQSISARLYLAGLHIATSSFNPDNMLGMTGEEKAIELARQCWLNRPSSVEEKCCLDNLKELCRGKSPTLSLLCMMS